MMFCDAQWEPRLSNSRILFGGLLIEKSELELRENLSFIPLSVKYLRTPRNEPLSGENSIIQPLKNEKKGLESYL